MSPRLECRPQLAGWVVVGLSRGCVPSMEGVVVKEMSRVPG